jgi:hypothetical protein
MQAHHASPHCLNDNKALCFWRDLKVEMAVALVTKTSNASSKVNRR